MATTAKANETTERLVRTTGDTYRTIVDRAVGLQEERNVRFAQTMVDRTIREVREQAESNRAMTAELLERAQRGREAFEDLARESLDAYMDLLFAPLSYYEEGLRLAQSGTEGFPIPGYDELNVSEVSSRLDGLSAAQIRELREYERRNKNRETLIEQFDRKLKAASA